MRFFSLPHGTVATVVIALVFLLVWVALGTLIHPESLWAPGDLSRFHADVMACEDCHQPFQGAASDRCIVCHDQKQFANRSRPAVSEFHRKAIFNKKSCMDCHTEHRGALAQITVGAMINPHGEFVFRATGTRSCTACHDLNDRFKSSSFVLDNAIVRHLMEEGEGAHQPGKMAACLRCHTGGRLDIEEAED